MASSAATEIDHKSLGFPVFFGRFFSQRASANLRRGEILAQRWRDLDLLAGQLTVAQTLEQLEAAA